ncbi:YihY/virulence factor BrkB family protein [Streptomyces sp. ICN988]|uniref:YihY/virulence factor BrkB family protein n=1 Tax=Streptomyces sp. ICN988 TaxID=2983765 RepID=UPI0021E38AE9|nr:YihY/virulence factor BrkB family protein [Streptomyces sp. ICN988]MCV2458177.1 YihY/virulence factor BrkB family protein [Streptomyces sp. ICN988]
MDALRRLDDFQQQHHWVGMPLGVVYKFADDQGLYLAALIAYYGFFSLFPLLLLLVSALTTLLQSDPSLREQVLDSALRNFPVLGRQLEENIHSFHSNGFALAVGVVGSLYGGLGVAQAIQHALNRVWAVPRHARPNPLLSRVRGFFFIGLLAVGLIATTGLSVLASSADAFGLLAGRGPRSGTILAVIMLNAVLLVLTVRILTRRKVGTRCLLLPALGAACAWQALQWGGAYYVSHFLSGASATYGFFGVVLGLLTWLYLAAFIFVVSVEAAAVGAHRLWPRSLLTPFTDNVRLSHADRLAYWSYAAAESFKGFEKVTVEFHGMPFAGAHQDDASGWDGDGGGGPRTGG